MTPDEIRNLADSAEGRLAIAWASVVAAMRDARTTRELADLLAAGRFDQAVETVLAAAPRFAVGWQKEFVRAGEAAAEDIGRELARVAQGEVVIDFDMVHTDAVRAMQENRLRLVREITDTQRRAIREAMQSGVERGLNPIDQARAFRDAIGLTQRQVRAVDNYRRLLSQNDPEALQRALRDKRFDPTVRRAIKDGKPLNRRQIDTMVARYRERMHKHRSEVIARTEGLRAVHEGTHSMFRQAVQDGKIGGDEVIREWNTAGDERVRTAESTSGQTSHASMHGQVVRGLETPFVSGGGNNLLYPGDPTAPGYDTIQCRCAVGVRLSMVGGPVLSAEIIEG